MYSVSVCVLVVRQHVGDRTFAGLRRGPAMDGKKAQMQALPASPLALTLYWCYQKGHIYGYLWECIIVFQV